MKQVSRISKLVGMAVLSLLCPVMAGVVWASLFLTNLKVSPRIPWSVPVMGLILWLAWRYMRGEGRPARTANARRAYLRARKVPTVVFWWAQLAAVLALIGLAGLWIVFFQLVKMPPNVLLPNFSKYPMGTLALMIVMGSLVSPFMEEGFFRGYLQVALERELRAPAAIMISSFVFMLGHLNHGALWPKLLVYFLVGVTFGAIARITDSIVPSIPVHIFGDVLFFTMVWPHDANRPLFWSGHAGAWFWIHVAQVIIFGTFSLMVFQKLRKAALRDKSGAQSSGKARLLGTEPQAKAAVPGISPMHSAVVHSA